MGGGSGGPGRGPGRGGPSGGGRSSNTWEHRGHQADADKKEGIDDAPPAPENNKEKWEQAARKVGDKQPSGGPEDQSSQPEVNQGAPKQGTNKIPQPANTASNTQNWIACENCGLFDHVTKDCRRIMCEIYGYSNHSTYECKRCVLWNIGPELCAT